MAWGQTIGGSGVAACYFPVTSPFPLGSRPLPASIDSFSGFNNWANAVVMLDFDVLLEQGIFKINCFFMITKGFWPSCMYFIISVNRAEREGAGYNLTPCVMSSEYICYSRVLLAPTNICFADIRMSANISFGHDEYLQIFVGGYITALGPIYAPYVDRTTNISPIGRISVM